MPSHLLPEKLPLKPANKSIAAFKNFVRQKNSATTQRSVNRICLLTSSPMPTPENAPRDQTRPPRFLADRQVMSPNPQDSDLA